MNTMTYDMNQSTFITETLDHELQMYCKSEAIPHHILFQKEKNAKKRRQLKYKRNQPKRVMRNTKILIDRLHALTLRLLLL